MTMIKPIACLFGVACFFAAGAAAARDTSHCEQEVTHHCVETTCPEFCDAVSEDGPSHAAAAAECKKSCTPEAWCKEVPLKGHGTPGHEELDDENRHELMACIAEEYDPDGAKTGRDTTVKWKESTAATYVKKVKSAHHDAPHAKPAAAPPPVAPAARGCACDVRQSAPTPGWLSLAGVALALGAVLRRRSRA
jgi:hypothetical protein